jgi:hypothetical protein
MRVMLLIKGDPEPGAAPSEELLAAMGRYNDELKQVGVLLDLAGLLPSAEGRRVKFSWGEPRGHRRAVRRVEGAARGLLDPPGGVDGRGCGMGRAVPPFEAWSPIYPGEYGADVEVEIRQVFELGS